MAHQGGKIENKEERIDMYNWLDKLEFELMELPKPDITIFLHMPYEVAQKLKQNREEIPDEHEKDKHHLIMAELSYIELAQKYNFKTIECSENKKPKTIEEINEKAYKIIYDFINTKDKQIKK